MRAKIALAVGMVTVFFGSLYAGAVVLNRSLAFDMPQLLATQTAKQLDAGYGVETISMGRTDLANYPVPFVIVYDKDGKALAGSGYLDSKLAELPKGVINHATKEKLHAVAWSPKEDVRLATVTAYSAKTGHFVVGGQSLANTDARNKLLAYVALVGYGVSLAAIGVYWLLAWRQKYALPSQPGSAQNDPTAAATAKDKKPASRKKTPAERKKPKSPKA